jgi:hypothetical protein
MWRSPQRGPSDSQISEISLDTTHTIQRALMADVVAPDEIPEANAAFTLSYGVGRVLAFGLGSLDMVDYGLSFFGTNTRALFTITASVILISGMPNLWVKETPFKPSVREDHRRPIEGSVSVKSSPSRTLVTRRQPLTRRLTRKLPHRPNPPLRACLP